jgi:hypothetical protein
MTMIRTRLAGGLGNQLFQFAAALALRGRADDPLFLGTQALSRYQVRRKFDMATLLDLPAWCRTDHAGARPSDLASMLLSARIGRLLPIYGANDKTFPELLKRSSQGRPRAHLWLDGYFQRGWTWPLFDAARRQIRAMLRPAPAPQNQPAADLVLHIRGSDFLKSPIHDVVDAGYYERALSVVHAACPGIRDAIVVTDDVQHARRLVDALRMPMSGIDIRILPGENRSWLDDFTLLRGARARILGNSTFSWWAAALDDDQAPTVSPQQWERGRYRDLILPWEQIVGV